MSSTLTCRISSTKTVSRVATAATSRRPWPAAAPMAAAAKMAAAVLSPTTIWPRPVAWRNTRPPPMNPIPVIAPAMALGAPCAPMMPTTPDPAPISANTRSPAVAPRTARSKPSP